jgi:hypothetical protein
MSLSKNPNAYIHVKPILDLAVDRGGGTYTLITNTEAIKWRAHANAYRKIISQGGPTNYDGLELLIDENKVVILVRAIKGQFTTQDGTIIDIKQDVPLSDDELLKSAKDFALEIGVDDDSR